MAEREALPQRTKEVIKHEAERMEKRRQQQQHGRSDEAARESARAESAVKRRKEERKRERSRQLNERDQLEKRGKHAEQQWLERESGSVRMRLRKAQDIEDDRIKRTKSILDEEVLVLVLLLLF
jgi:hypothetical protein